MEEREAFYTAKPVEQQVTKKEFEEYIKNYPRELVVDCTLTSDPPVVSYNDFALANHWPYSVVARTWIYSNIPNDRYYEPEDAHRYYIIVNYEELFKSKTGYEA